MKSGRVLASAGQQTFESGSSSLFGTMCAHNMLPTRPPQCGRKRKLLFSARQLSNQERRSRPQFDGQRSRLAGRMKRKHSRVWQRQSCGGHQENLCVSCHDRRRVCRPMLCVPVCGARSRPAEAELASTCQFAAKSSTACFSRGAQAAAVRACAGRSDGACPRKEWLELATLQCHTQRDSDNLPLTSQQLAAVARLALPQRSPCPMQRRPASGPPPLQLASHRREPEDARGAGGRPRS